MIQIYGILQRSGTNLLNQILLLHQDCVRPAVKIREDWFVDYSDSLWEYAELLFRMWSNPNWVGKQFSKTDFFSKIGEALMDYLADAITDLADKVLVTKTPSVVNINRCFDLFPSAKVIIIVRDPRDVAASAFRTWKVAVAATIARWNRGCHHIAMFEKSTKPERYMLIRFEDLVKEPKSVTRKMLEFLQLDENRFSWEELNRLPVFGSSDNARWEIVEKNDSFSPFGKWRLLPKRQQAALRRISSPYCTYFGYPTKDDDVLSALPYREERLRLGLGGKTPGLLYERIAKARIGLRILAEGILGSKAIQYLRSR